MSAKTSLSLLALVLLATHAFAQDAIHGRCVGVTDGDTIRVLAPGYQLLQIRLAWRVTTYTGELLSEAGYTDDQPAEAEVTA